MVDEYRDADLISDYKCFVMGNIRQYVKKYTMYRCGKLEATQQSIYILTSNHQIMKCVRLS